MSNQDISIDPYFDLTQTERIHYRMLAYHAMSRPETLTDEQREEWEWAKRHLYAIDEPASEEASNEHRS